MEERQFSSGVLLRREIQLEKEMKLFTEAYFRSEQIIIMIKMNGETPEVRSDKRKKRRNSETERKREKRRDKERKIEKTREKD